MPKLYSSNKIVRVLERKSFRFVSQRGSHLKFSSASRVVIVPANRREVPVGTFRSILRQSGLSESDFS
ncbi:MAG: type II toxin-antitoxin system HicA family toxin [Candidatus Taylorbacteria bacterium]|nr:type II toxin-antitoxin system HicA family toxin [Candidatus Taylorbacteria bacterium]